MDRETIRENRIKKAAKYLYRLVLPPIMFGVVRNFFLDVEVQDPSLIDGFKSILAVALLGVSGALITQPRSDFLSILGQMGVCASAALAPETPVTQDWLVAGLALHYSGIVGGTFVPEAEIQNN